MILPNCNSKDPEVNKMFQLVDERLSELYSVHGVVELRGDMRLQEPPSSPTTCRDMNSNSLAKAWLYYDGANHNIINSYNVDSVEVGTGAGSYIAKIKVRPTTDHPIVIVNAATTTPLAAMATITESGTQLTVSIQSSTFAGVATDAYIYPVMLGH